MYITEKEIMTQHIALEKTHNQIISQKDEIQSFLCKTKQHKFVFLGCGSSYMLAKSCQNIFMTKPDTVAYALSGGDYLVNPEYYKETIKDSIVIPLSRSGLTSEIILSVQIMKKTTNVKVLSIIMKEESELSNISDMTIKLPWAFDNSICQTRCVTNLYTATLLLNGICYDDKNLINSIKTAIDQNEDFKNEYRPLLEEIGNTDFDNVVVLADGGLCGLAEEAALVFTEISMINGSYFNMLDYRHGPIVLNTKKTLTILAMCPSDNDYQKDMVDDIKSHGGIVVTLSNHKNNIYGADLNVIIKNIDSYLAWGIPFIYIAQMISFTKAKDLGGNPDKPTGLNACIELDNK